MQAFASVHTWVRPQPATQILLKKLPVHLAPECNQSRKLELIILNAGGNTVFLPWKCVACGRVDFQGVAPQKAAQTASSRVINKLEACCMTGKLLAVNSPQSASLFTPTPIVGRV